MPLHPSLFFLSRAYDKFQRNSSNACLTFTFSKAFYLRAQFLGIPNMAAKSISASARRLSNATTYPKGYPPCSKCLQDEGPHKRINVKQIWTGIVVKATLLQIRQNKIVAFKSYLCCFCTEQFKGVIISTSQTKVQGHFLCQQHKFLTVFYILSLDSVKNILLYLHDTILDSISNCSCNKG